MATEKAIVEEVNNSKLRLAPAIDYSKEKINESMLPGYGGMKSYSDKVLDISRKIGDSIRESYRKAEDVSKNLYKSLKGNISDSYNLQPAYDTGSCGYC